MKMTSSSTVSVVTQLFASLLLALALANGSANAAVSVSNRTLLVDGEPFRVRGVAYGSVPVGFTPSSRGDWYADTPRVRRDLDWIREMGANTLRLYSWDNDECHRGFLDACLERGLRVIIAFPFDFARLDTPAGRDAMLAELRQTVRAHADHPAVLAYALGNELNLHHGGLNSTVWDFVAELRDAAHEAEAPAWHPVGSPLADGNGIFDVLGAYDGVAFDVSMVQLYRGPSFGSFWDSAAAAGVSTPVLLTEMGSDAFIEGRSRAEAEQTQADWNAGMWADLEAHAGVAAGGTLFQWTDGWFKCADGDNSAQETCVSRGTFPGDGGGQSEFFGLAAVEAPSAGGDPEQPDEIRARPVYCRFRELWADGGGDADLGGCDARAVGTAPLEFEVSGAAADAYVRGGASADTNFAGEATLEVKASAADPSYARQSLLAFEVPASLVPPEARAGLFSATVTLSRSFMSETRPYSFEARAFAGAGWNAANTTWNARPAGAAAAAPLAAAAGVATRFEGDAVVALDVLAEVREAFARMDADGAAAAAFSLWLLRPGGWPDDQLRLDFHSSEADDESLRPRLTLVARNASLAAAPPAAVDCVVAPGEWSACSESCERTRSYAVATAASGGGAACPDPLPVDDAEACADGLCGCGKAQETALEAVGDATVRGGAFAGDNLGVEQTLSVKLASPDFTREAVVGFAVPSAAALGWSADTAVLSATLRLHVEGVFESGGVDFELAVEAAAPGRGSNESVVTFDTAIACASSAPVVSLPGGVLTVPRATAGAYVEVDVAAEVADHLGGPLWFRLARPEGSNAALLVITSREGASPPQLVLRAVDGGGGACACPPLPCEGGTVGADTCGCECAAATASFNPASGSCECPAVPCEGGAVGTDTCECECEAPLVPFGGACACPAGVACEGGSVDPDTCECVCEAPLVPSGGACACPAGVACEGGSVDPDTCECACEAPLVPSGGACACPADVACEFGAVDPASCVCTECEEGFYGPLCASTYESCASSGNEECGERGTCADVPRDPVTGAGGYNCSCAAGWQGVLCADDVDECAAGTGPACGEHGACSNLPGSAECRCDDGWEGATCETVVLDGGDDGDGDSGDDGDGDSSRSSASSSAFPVWLAATVGGVVLLAACLAICCARRRSKKLAAAASTGGTAAAGKTKATAEGATEMAPTPGSSAALFAATGAKGKRNSSFRTGDLPQPSSGPASPTSQGSGAGGAPASPDRFFEGAIAALSEDDDDNDDGASYASDDAELSLTANSNSGSDESGVVAALEAAVRGADHVVMPVLPPAASGGDPLPPPPPPPDDEYVGSESREYLDGPDLFFDDV